MKTILVIDDEANIRQLYRDELREAGYDVRTAAGWDEARAALDAGLPDLVTLDINLGGGPTGIDVLRLIKETAKELPVIVVTAYSEFKADFGVWAADDYVVKSSDLGELKDRIARVLAGSSR